MEFVLYSFFSLQTDSWSYRLSLCGGSTGMLWEGIARCPSTQMLIVFSDSSWLPVWCLLCVASLGQKWLLITYHTALKKWAISFLFSCSYSCYLFFFFWERNVNKGLEVSVLLLIPYMPSFAWVPWALSCGTGLLDLFFSLVTLVILLFIPGACLMLIRSSTSCCLQRCALESRAPSKDHVGGLKQLYETPPFPDKIPLTFLVT